MRSKLANRSRLEGDTPPYITSPPGSDQFCPLAHEARVDRHRLLGGLAEVEALAEVDVELAHRLELVDALDALGDHAAAVLVRALDEGGHQAAAGRRVLDAGGH